MKKTLHKLVDTTTNAVRFVEFTFNEWMDSIRSDGLDHWVLPYEGVDYYDYGIVRKKRHMPVRTWPLVSSAAGIHEDEVPDQMRIDKQNGVPTEYIDGDPVLTSKSHRKKYLASRGIFDRNAGFGDPTPANM